ncbi:MAG: hypothetical protein KJO41_07565 [Bacteroidia bacterium]|nr:hypothetical protein [Bacteroidia bacterium]NND25910.1 hypothetical protein [Flavobacteriaceae bacterium]MBT8278844.1 hypothetical protein [Bacteroidia bacterium]NNK60749.1 hypothetical protein [Flavobacteriaceae bacterium]NNL33560.1 hypothetical protein [Flavobacteriaceae bacterium]
MTIELIVFVGAILFGILLYWRESNGNGMYRFVNKIVNSKALQMKADDKTGFVYQQKFILRLVYVTALFLVLMLIMKFLIPINYTTVSIFASLIVGTIIGTYVATFVLKSGKIIEEKGDSIEDIVSDTFEKGKDFIEDITSKDDAEELSSDEVPEENTPIEPNEKKSARERLKDKGYLK